MQAFVGDPVLIRGECEVLLLSTDVVGAVYLIQILLLCKDVGLHFDLLNPFLQLLLELIVELLFKLSFKLKLLVLEMLQLRGS